MALLEASFSMGDISSNMVRVLSHIHIQDSTLGDQPSILGGMAHSSWEVGSMVNMEAFPHTKDFCSYQE